MTKWANIFAIKIITIMMILLSKPGFSLNPTDVTCSGEYVWVATDEGIFIFNQNTEQFGQIKPQQYGSIHNQCRTIEKMPDGSMWMGISDRNILRYYQGQSAMLDKNSLGGTQIGDVNSIAWDGSHIWLSSGFSVNLYNGHSLLTFFDLEWAGLSSPPVRDIAIDKDGTAWSVGQAGLIHYVPEDSTMIQDQRFLSTGGQQLLLENGVFWIASYPRIPVHTGGLVVISGDSVKTYITDNSGIPSNKIFDLVFDDTGTIWIAADRALASFDGTDWTVYKHPVFDFEIRSLAIDDRGNKWIGTQSHDLVKFDGTDWEIYPFPDSTSSMVEQNTRPSALELYRIYPNPSNSSITIQFKIPQTGRVVVSIYTVTGEKIISLIDETLHQGTYSKSLTTEFLSSGIYFVRIQSEHDIRTSKFLIVK